MAIYIGVQPLNSMSKSTFDITKDELEITLSYSNQCQPSKTPKETFLHHPNLQIENISKYCNKNNSPLNNGRHTKQDPRDRNIFSGGALYIMFDNHY